MDGDHRCQYELCDRESMATYLADPTARWDLCASHRLYVRHALEHPEEGWRVDASATTVRVMRTQ